METSERDKKYLFRETQDWQKSKAENTANYLGAYSIMAGMAGILVLPAMAFMYLKNGVFPDWCLFTLVGNFLPTSLQYWLAVPKDWIGLHKIVYYILFDVPLTLDFFAIAGIFSFISSVFASRAERYTTANRCLLFLLPLFFQQ
jgi:hypothetical protein